MNKISVIDAELKTILHRRINAHFVTSKALAWLSTDVNTPIVDAWKSLTNTSKTFLTAQAGKIIYTQAINLCTNENIIAAIDESLLQIEASPELACDERKVFDAMVKKILGPRPRPRTGVRTTT